MKQYIYALIDPRNGAVACRAAAEAKGLGYKRISAQILGTRPVTDENHFEFVDQGQKRKS